MGGLLGGGGKGYVGPPPFQIIGGGGGCHPWPPSSYAYVTYVLALTVTELKEAKWSKYPNHKSELVSHLNIDNPKIFDNR